MLEEIIKAIPIFISSMFKFILGPIGGFVAGLSPITTIFATTGGMMVSVFMFTFFGNWLKPYVISLFPRSKKKFSKKNKRFVTIWRKYGMVGLAFLTPLLLTPIGGTILAVVFGAPKFRLIFYMFISALLWAVILTSVVYIFGKSIFPDFMGI